MKPASVGELSSSGELLKVGAQRSWFTPQNGTAHHPRSSGPLDGSLPTPAAYVLLQLSRLLSRIALAPTQRAYYAPGVEQTALIFPLPGGQELVPMDGNVHKLPQWTMINSYLTCVLHRIQVLFTVPEHLMRRPVEASTDVFGLGPLRCEVPTHKRLQQTAAGFPFLAFVCLMRHEVIRLGFRS